MRRSLLSVIASLFLAASAQTAPDDRIAVLEFELNDLTLDPGNSAELERTASIKPMLEKALTAANHPTVAVDAAAQGTQTKVSATCSITPMPPRRSGAPQARIG